MTAPPGAVFLSYASEDAPAALRLCEDLRAAGIEVWLDQSALRGGDAWDAAIQKQIRECALFVPLISASTNARGEGYAEAARLLQVPYGSPAPWVYEDHPEVILVKDDRHYDVLINHPPPL